MYFTRMDRTPNPFRFGTSLTREDLVDRVEEVQNVTQTLLDGARLFVIGPRRFGKTSILNVAKAEASAKGVPTVLVNAEATLTLNDLAGELVAAIANALPLGLKERSLRVVEWFAALRPHVTYEPTTDSISVGVTPINPDKDTPSLVEVLGRANAIAQERGIIIGIIIDEFQEISRREGIAAEKQLRACVQEHRHLAYVFAGSDTTMMAAMVTQYKRPFYRLGDTLMLGEIPAADMIEFIQNSFVNSEVSISGAVCELILRECGGVPYNIQKLCYRTYSSVMLKGLETVDSQVVEDAINSIVQGEALIYQTLFRTQPLSRRKILSALADPRLSKLSPALLARATKSPDSTIRSALKILVAQDILRPALTFKDHVFVDPFFALFINGDYSV